MLSRENLTLNPKTAATQRPLRAAHSDRLSRTGPLKDEEGLLDGRMQTTSSLVKDLNPIQPKQLAQGSYQLQFAIQQLQQQKLKSHQFLDRRQAQVSNQPSATHIQVSTKLPCSPPSSMLWPGHTHIQTCVGPGLVPKPPNGPREGQIQKTATKRLIK
ncbi:tubulin polyglutamylase TTLL5 [Austrofundulus limnaeus]|nr:PREDICTED: tubulin polyglutamylase TTLL5-like [Austrofundulus limnaeus]